MFQKGGTIFLSSDWRMDMKTKHVILLTVGILILVAAISVGATVIIPNYLEKAAATPVPTLAPTPTPTVRPFTPPPFEENAVEGAPDGIDKELDYREMKLGEAGIFGMCGNLTLNEDSIDVYYTNVEENTCWTKIVVYDEQGVNKLGETGILKPGQYVKSVKLNPAPVKSGMLTVKMLTYEPDTYYSKGSATAKVVLTVK
jgi:hypothetical protein